MWICLGVWLEPAYNFTIKDMSMTSSITSNITNRRVFMLQAVAGTGALALASAAQAQAMVSETDPAASGLAYKADATKVDKAKNPKYAAGQICGNCALFQGKAGDKAGGCPLFAGKQVATAGWCSAYAKKG